MKKIYTLIPILLLTVTNMVIAQGWCLTDMSGPDYLIQNNISVSPRNLETISIRVFAHKIGLDDGSFAIDDQEVVNAIGILNQDYQDHNISFQLIGIDQINDFYFFHSPAVFL